jgi:cephalosporin-C deacetylase
MAEALPRPDGFAEFWQEAFAEAAEAPLDFSLTASEKEAPGHAIWRLSMRGIGGEALHGWAAQPHDEDKAPGFLWIPPYGRWSMPPNEYGTRPGMASLSFNFFGEDAFHEEAYTPARGYFAQGVESPQTWVFRTMFQNAVIAAHTLASLDFADEDRIGAMGMSQGGGIAIWLGAWCPLVRAVCGDMPFLGGFGWVMDQLERWRYPLKEIHDWIGGDPVRAAQARQTIAWFDTVSQAEHCHRPTRISLGQKDPAVRPEQARAIFKALPGEKELAEFDWGHDWTPAMISGNHAWLIKNLLAP